MGSTGIPVLATFDGKPELKAGGLTIDWSLFAALGAPLVTVPEGLSLQTGQKWFRFGQVLSKVTNLAAQTLTVTGTPTGGTFAMTVTRPDTSMSQSVVVPYNQTVAGLQAQLDAVLGAGNSVVSGAGALPGNVLTTTVAGSLIYTNLPTFVMTTNALTGGAGPTVAFAQTGPTNSGWFGPYDPAATDGRQTPSAGNIFIANETVVQTGVLGINIGTLINTTQIGGAIFGGRVWRNRVIATTGTHSLAAGPTFAELFAVLPRVQFVDN